MSKSWENVFNKDGSFKLKGYDPFRVSDNEENFHNYLFDEDGDIHYEFESLSAWIDSKGVSWKSDAVKLYYAEQFSGNTKGNYSSVYMWR